MDERDTNSTDEIEISPEMIGAAEEIIRGKIDSTAAGPLFSASDLAREVYRAMWRRRTQTHP